MIVINRPTPKLIEMLGGTAKKEDRKYRFAKYCLDTITDNGDKAVFNTLTESVVLIRKGEELDEESITYLVENLFMVPEEFDDNQRCDKLWAETHPKNKEMKRNFNTYTIFTTTDCNARCFYCYEKGVDKIKMSKETALRVADFIEKSKGEKTNSISITWFGGEPTTNPEAIDIICQKLQEKGIKYKTNIISNGYLFDDALVEKAKTLWKLTSAQITIDGTESVYNKAKNYIYGKDINAFQVVTNNIERLLKAGIAITIRMNVDLYNAEDIKTLIPALQERFSPYGKIYSLYINPLFEAFTENTKRDEEKEKKLYEKFLELDTLLESYGHPGQFHRNYPKHMCMGDNIHSITVLPNGRIGVCEHFIDSEYIGNIDDGILDVDKMVEWKEASKNDMDICQECPFKGNCYRITHCLEQTYCNKYIRDRKIYREKGALKKYVENALKRGVDGIIIKPFTLIKDGDNIYFLLTKISCENLPEPSNEDFLRFINTNTNFTKYNITIDEISSRRVESVIGEKSMDVYKIDITKHPNINKEIMFTWQPYFDMYGGRLIINNGETIISRW